MDNRVKIRAESESDYPSPIDQDLLTDELLETAAHLGCFDNMAKEALEDYERGKVFDL